MTKDSSPNITRRQAVQAVRDLRDGKKLPARIYTIEGIFDETNAAEALPTRQY
jgi:hypothetical protein